MRRSVSWSGHLGNSIILFVDIVTLAESAVVHYLIIYSAPIFCLFQLTFCYIIYLGHILYEFIEFWTLRVSNPIKNIKCTKSKSRNRIPSTSKSSAISCKSKSIISVGIYEIKESPIFFYKWGSTTNFKLIMAVKNIHHSFWMPNKIINDWNIHKISSLRKGQSCHWAWRNIPTILYLQLSVITGRQYCCSGLLPRL